MESPRPINAPPTGPSGVNILPRSPILLTIAMVMAPPAIPVAAIPAAFPVKDNPASFSFFVRDTILLKEPITPNRPFFSSPNKNLWNVSDFATMEVVIPRSAPAIGPPTNVPRIPPPVIAPRAPPMTAPAINGFFRSLTYFCIFLEINPLSRSSSPNNHFLNLSPLLATPIAVPAKAPPIGPPTIAPNNPPDAMPMVPPSNPPLIAFGAFSLMDVCINFKTFSLVTSTPCLSCFPNIASCQLTNESLIPLLM